VYLGARKLIIPYKPPVVVAGGGGPLAGPTILIDEDHDVNEQTKTTASFTPSNNSLLVAICRVGRNTADSQPSNMISDSQSGTWTDELMYWPGDNLEMSVLYIQQITTGTSMTVTFDIGSGYIMDDAEITIVEFTGAHTTSPITQSGTYSSIDSGSGAWTESITATASDSTTIVFKYGKPQNSPTSTFWQTDSAWTEEQQKDVASTAWSAWTTTIDGTTSELHADRFDTVGSSGNVLWMEIAEAA
jgi:hypothetical protein